MKNDLICPQMFGQISGPETGLVVKVLGVAVGADVTVAVWRIFCGFNRFASRHTSLWEWRPLCAFAVECVILCDGGGWAELHKHRFKETDTIFVWTKIRRGAVIHASLWAMSTMAVRYDHSCLLTGPFLSSFKGFAKGTFRFIFQALAHTMMLLVPCSLAQPADHSSRIL